MLPGYSIYQMTRKIVISQSLYDMLNFIFQNAFIIQVSRGSCRACPEEVLGP